MSPARQAWLAQGLALLAEQGAPALTLERLCERVGMSKGAFYHHFGSVPKFRTALLACFETELTTAVIEAVDACGDLSPRDKLHTLLAEAAKSEHGPQVEIAVRAWAKQDPEAAAVQERVDATRIAYLRGVCEQTGHAKPDLMAQLLYLMLVGAEHLMPPLPKDELREMYELLYPLLDGVLSCAPTLEYATA